MLRLLLTRRWLGALALAAVFALTCVYLGRWQWGRHVDKAAAADLVSRHYDARPVPLDHVLPAGAGMPDDAVWTHVEVTGRYVDGARLWARNRPQNVVYGYEVLAPLELASGDALLVDRGWVANAARADLLPDVPPEPTGPVRLTGWLRQSEPSLDRTLPHGQVASIDVTEAARQTGLTLRPAYLVLDTERTSDGATPPRPARLLPPDTNTGPHFAYALQWWGAAPVGFVVVFVYLRREWRDRHLLRSGTGRGPRPGAPTAPTRPAAPPKPKKVRIWDEEDE